ncbi:cobalt-precorrin-4/precorrin-4 C(11)-methyltransferase [Saccharothrix yanglingensis]|uniref:Cobalt-precorrin-4 C(11)-methyltransferase n=1 Tax=Saccharothrix yanglingensis TaxID=659496 RepID=A0ABU0X2I0_9PSEU|nr:cobalt-precorrin-4/precorrin-4 C(11)-methyltransferase [Saccharothrix yanglingensis]MDQ2586335.1 cobalt-precorrin-4 C(11)-methyltransferase [Saccharothrix yanglingensis]
MTGRVSFVGAGPGAADLITVRGAKRIAEADAVVWSPAVIEVEAVREHARPDAELVDFSRVPEIEVVELYRRASAGKLKVVRLHAGDPALWGGLTEQQDTCRRLGLDTEVVPGVSQVSAAAAAVGRELTTSDVAQSLVLTGPETAEHVEDFAAHGTTMAISASGARAGLVVERLRAGGYPDETPVVVAHKVSLPDETVAQTTIGGLEACVKEHKLYRTTLFLVGEALAQPPARRRSPSVEGDEPVRRSKWSRRTQRPAGDSPSAAAWSAVHEWQEAARTKRAAKAAEAADPGAPVLELVVDESAAGSPAAGSTAVEGPVAEGGADGPPAEPKPKTVVAAATTPKPVGVRASTTPRKPVGSRAKKSKRAT